MLMLANQFARQHFAEGSRPSATTLRTWINTGKLPGKRIGNNYYVDLNKYHAEGDNLVEKVLNDA